MIRKLVLVTLFVLAIDLSTAYAERFDIEGYVVRLDANCAVIVSKDSKARSEDSAYRFYGIGFPSEKQPFGPEVRKYLRDVLSKGTRIYIKKMRDSGGKDSLPEALIQVYGESLNYGLIRAGLAWVDRQRCRDLYCRRWHIAEHKAIEARKGLWSVDVPTPPWQWAR